MVTQNPTHTCWLCGKDADLRACKIDEHGKTVHETCYLARVALETKTHPAPITSRPLTKSGPPNGL